MGVHYGPRPTGNLPPITTPPTADPASGNTKPVNPSSWTRESDWLAMPNVVETDQVFYGLVAIHDVPHNFLTFRAQGAYTIDWGDGTPTENYTSNATARHDYDWSSVSSSTLTSRGYRQCMVTVTPQGGNNLTAINLNDKHNQAGLTNYTSSGWLDIKFSMNNVGTFYLYNSVWRHSVLERCHWVASSCSQTSGNQLFRHCWAMRSIPNLPFASLTDCFFMFGHCDNLGDDGYPTLPSTATSNNFHYMFYLNRQLQTAPVLDTGNATNMSYMFRLCCRLKYIPPLNFQNNLYSQYQFQNCFNLELFSDVSWDFAKVTRCEYMFSGCYAIRYLPAMDTSAVTRMDGMFLSLRSLTEMPEVDLSACTNAYRLMESCTKVKYTRFVGSNSNITRMDRMFLACYRLEYLPSLDTSSITRADNMFNGCINLKRLTQDTFDLSACTRINGMFAGMNQLRVAPVLLNSSLVVDLDNLFTSCYYLTEIGYIDTQSVTDFYRMFINCYSLTGLDWELDCRSATRLRGIFHSCISLRKSPALRNINLVNEATEFRDLYYNCNSLQEFTNIELDTSNATTFYYMFYNCLSLATIPFNFDTSKCIDMRGMFRYCRVLESFNQTNDAFDTTWLRNYDAMFWDCHNLQEVPDIEINNINTDINGTAVSQNTNLDYIFYGCYNLREIPANFFNKTYLTADGTPKSFDGYRLFTNCFTINTLPTMSFGQINRFYQFIQSCRNIEYLPTMDTSNGGDMRYAFAYMYALREMPAGVDLSSCTTAYAFAINPRAMTYLPDLNGPGASCTDFRYMFYGSETLTNVDATFDTSGATNVARMWAYCRALKKLPGTYNLNNITTESTSATAGINQFILDCSSLQEINVTNVRRQMYFRNASFDRAQLVNMFNNLVDNSSPELKPDGTTRATAYTLFISGNFGLQTLTQADRDIALNKNWILNG